MDVLAYSWPFRGFDCSHINECVGESISVPEEYSGILSRRLFIIYFLANSMFQKVIEVLGNIYVIRLSDRPNKKYVAWLAGPATKTREGYLRMLSSPVHFGDTRYQHYRDFFEQYKHLDHLDNRRRKNYLSRHQHTDIEDPRSPAFWSWNYLWWKSDE